ncbi:hypothetical protein ACE0DR_25275, partial [Azotobacter sp. CWF10]
MVDVDELAATAPHTTQPAIADTGSRITLDLEINIAPSRGRRDRDETLTRDCPAGRRLGGGGASAAAAVTDPEA